MTITKKKLLFIISSMYGGGAERTLLELLKNLDSDKYAITLLVITYEGIYLDHIPKNITVKYIFKTSTSKYFSRIINSIKYRFLYKLMMHPTLIHKLILSDNYDYEISFTEGGPLQILLARTNAHKIARLCTNFAYKQDLPSSTNDSFKVYGHNFIIPIVVAHTIWCISNDQANLFNKYFPHYSSKTKVFSNFRNMNEVIELSNAFEVSFAKKTILAIGRLEEVKRFDILLKAFALVNNSGWCLKIIGDGSLMNSLKQLAFDLGISESVEFLGFQVNPYPYLKNADIFTLTSDYEGFANVLIEALALEVPIIATNCEVGPSEILANGEYGLLTPTGDQVSFARNLQLLINDHNLYQKFKRKSRTRAYDFDVKNTIAKLDKFF